MRKLKKKKKKKTELYERVFSSYLCHQIYGKNRVQLKTSLSHFFLKVESFEENSQKALSFI